VDKELANIRKNFTGTRESAYDRKKYTWKLVYIFMLGYDVDFGTEQILKLLRGTSFAEKVAGYMAVSVLIGQQDEVVGAVCAAIRDDLRSTFDSVQCLALSAIANKGGKRIAASLAPDVREMTFSRSVFPPVRRRAALTLLRVYRVDPAYLPMPEHAASVMALLDDKDVSVKMAGLILMTGVAHKHSEHFTEAVPLVVRYYHAAQRRVRDDYVYHHANAPWFQVQCLRFLQMYDRPTDVAVAKMLQDALEATLSNTKVTRSVNRNNAEHSVLFEAVNLIIKQGNTADSKLRNLAVQHLTRFVNIKEPNIRYLGLVAMTKLAKLEGTAEQIKKQQKAVLVSLKDTDLSIRRRALDLLFVMCDRSNAMSIVKELLNYLALAEFSIKEEMVLRLAILAERFAPNMKWYVDTILQLVGSSGDFVSDDIWHRVVYMVTNNKDLQAYAAMKLYRMVQSTTAHETTVKLAGYVLGEFGFLLVTPETCQDVEGAPVSGGEQFAALQQHVASVDIPTRCLLLTAFLKLQNMYPELKAEVLPLFEQYSAVMDVELQQRAVEYFHLPLVDDHVTAEVLAAMPEFPEKASGLEERLQKKGGKKSADEWGGAAVDADEPQKAEAEEEEIAAAQGSSSTPTVRPPTPEAAVDLEDDLLGVNTPSAPAASAGASSGTLPTSADVRMGLKAGAPVREWLAAFAGTARGKLYEDEYVQIGAQVDMNGDTGTVTLFIGNCTDAPLNLLKVRIPDVPQFKVDVGDVDPVLGRGQQAKVPIQVQCLRPFTATAQLQISFLSAPANGHALPLRLPVFASHFVAPVAVTKETYGARWKALQAETGQAGHGSPSVQHASSVLKQLHFEETLSDASAIYAAGSFKTATVSANGAKVVVGCLVKVSVLAAGYGVEMRTQHPEVSKSLVNIVKAELAEK